MMILLCWLIQDEIFGVYSYENFLNDLHYIQLIAYVSESDFPSLLFQYVLLISGWFPSSCLADA